MTAKRRLAHALLLPTKASSPGAETSGSTRTRSRRRQEGSSLCTALPICARFAGRRACRSAVRTSSWPARGRRFPERSTRQKKVLARDGGYCQTPGCSRSAVHAHHIVYRSAGGSDGPANLTSLRAAHHLHGVHMGYVRVRGKAPDALQWHLGPS